MTEPDSSRGADEAPEPRVERVLAPNPGPFTLEGTNTWIVGRDPAVVIDPGPDDDAHLEAVAAAAGSVGVIVVSHDHPDHAPGAAPLGLMVDAPVRSFGRVGDGRPLADAEVVTAGGARLLVVHTPGHTGDHLAFLLEETGAVFTGDAVLGRGTSVIDPPDGDVRRYVESLERLLSMRPSTILPGHGPVVRDAVGKLREYIEHRAERELQVLAALERRADASGAAPVDLVPDIYDDTPAELHPVAARQVLAHLLKLEEDGRARRVGAGADRFAPTASS